MPDGFPNSGAQVLLLVTFFSGLIGEKRQLLFLLCFPVSMCNVQSAFWGGGVAQVTLASLVAGEK